MYPNLSCSITNIYKYKLTDVAQLIKKSNSFLHLDVMDGVYVENSLFNKKEDLMLIHDLNCSLDVHLMIDEPDKNIKKFLDLRPNIISYHPEAISSINKFDLIDNIKKENILAGISICPELEESDYFDIMEKLDVILIMSVKPGKGGQSFIFDTLKKVENIKNFIIQNNLKTKIHIDGGVNSENYQIIKNSGVDTCIVGSDIFKVENLSEVEKKINFFSL